MIRVLQNDRKHQRFSVKKKVYQTFLFEEEKEKNQKSPIERAKDSDDKLDQKRVRISEKMGSFSAELQF